MSPPSETAQAGDEGFGEDCSQDSLFPGCYSQSAAAALPILAVPANHGGVADAPQAVAAGGHAVVPHLAGWLCLASWLKPAHIHMLRLPKRRAHITEAGQPE